MTAQMKEPHTTLSGRYLVSSSLVEMNHRTLITISKLSMMDATSWRVFS